MKEHKSRRNSTLTAVASDQTLIAKALAREDFDFAARLLLVGVARTVDKMPAGAFEELLNSVNGRKNAPKRKKNTL